MRGAPFRLLAATIATAGFAAGTEAAPRAVVELFTSQGCSSCPPADELLAKLARDPDIIALSLPVDYWDRLGWKDTLARHEFTERQTAYADVRGDGQVYTPQAVVNGREHAVGSERSSIESAAAATAAGLEVALNIERGSEGIVISVGDGQDKTRAQGDVVLLPYVSAREVAIGRGENARRKVTYTNVVGEIHVVAGWTGAAMKQSVPAAALKGYDGVAVLLQQGSTAKPGAILGAARASLQ
jgi:hypothetical protein